jgi:hypothetical protein
LQKLVRRSEEGHAEEEEVDACSLKRLAESDDAGVRVEQTVEVKETEGHDIGAGDDWGGRVRQFGSV